MRPILSWLTPELNAMQPGFLNDYRTLAEEGRSACCAVAKRRPIAASLAASALPANRIGGQSCESCDFSLPSLYSTSSDVTIEMGRSTEFR